MAFAAITHVWKKDVEPLFKKVAAPQCPLQV